MPYTPTTWVDGVTPVNATNLNKLENGLAAAVGIPADVVVANNTHLIRNRFLVGDTQAAFYLRGDGYNGWGPGGSVGLDTNLYRSGVAQLQTESSLFLRGGNGTYLAVFANLTDPNSRMYIDGASGAINWGPGSSGADVGITRAGVGVLSLGGSLQVSGSVTATSTINLNGGTSYLYSGGSPAGYAVVISRVSGDADNRFTLSNDGHMYWGNGTLAIDTQLYRIAAGVLRTDGQMQVGGNFVVTAAIYSQPTGSGGGFLYTPTAVGGTALISQIAGEANPKFLIGTDGLLVWGAGGATAQDTNLYRSGVGNLKTDGSLEVGTTVYSHAAVASAAAFAAQDLASTGYIIIGKRTADTNYRWIVENDGKMNWGPGGATAADTTLYRSGVSVLKTDNILLAGNDIRAHDGLSTQVRIGNSSSNASIAFGSALDTVLYRGAAGILKTDGSVAHMGRGTTLPASPIDGQEYILVDSLTVPTYNWKFRYDSGISDAYKWVYVGGAPVTAVQNTSGTFTSNAAYIDPTNLCSLTLVRAGIYDVSFGVSQSNNTGSQLMNYAVKVGAGTPVDAESIYLYSPTTGIAITGTKTMVRKTVAASDLLKIQVKPTGNGNANHQWLSVVPQRVS